MEVAGKQSQFLARLEVDGQSVGMLVVGAQVAMIAKFFRVDWSEDDCVLCTQIVYNEFNWLRAAEFKYFVNRVFSGKYSSPKNLSPAIICEWLRSFATEMLEARRQQSSSWTPPENPVSDEVFNKGMAEIIATCLENKPSEDVKARFPPLEQVIENLKKLSKENE